MQKPGLTALFGCGRGYTGGALGSGATGRLGGMSVGDGCRAGFETSLVESFAVARR